MYYKMKKIPESIDIIIGKRNTNKDAYYEALNAAQESGQRMGYAQGRDETAREILKDLNNRYNECGGAEDVAIMLYDWLSEMSKKHGIEEE